jgi:hypothetical protein
MPKRAFSLATLRSAATARLTPPPTHTPSMAAITGLGQASTASTARPMMSLVAAAAFASR